MNKKKININEKNINKNLYTNNTPDPEILIRTGTPIELAIFNLAINIF